MLILRSILKSNTYEEEIRIPVIYIPKSEDSGWTQNSFYEVKRHELNFYLIIIINGIFKQHS